MEEGQRIPSSHPQCQIPKKFKEDLNKLLLQYVCMLSLKRMLFYIMIMTKRPIGQKPIAFGGIGTYLKVHICLILKNRTQLGIGLA